MSEQILTRAGTVGDGPIVVAPDGREAVDLDGLGIIWMIDGADAGERFSIVHHTLAPRLLAAPLHLHHREDEYSYVLEGRLGALLGDDVVEAGPGAWVYKPRGQWHTFWNAGDEPCHIIELISPAGFEHYFRALAESWPDVDAFASLNDRYGLEMDFGSVDVLTQRFGLVSGDPRE